MRSKSARALHALLFLYAAAGLTYYVAGAVALYSEFFRSAEYARTPIEFGDDGRTITFVREGTKAPGLHTGQILETLNGVPFTGRAQLNDVVARSKPGDTVNFGIRTPKGLTRQIRVPLPAWEGPNFSLGGNIAFLTPVLLVPLLGLAVGCWVVAARPRDRNAWFVLVLLTFPEVGFGNLDWSFWPGIWFILLGAWYMVLQKAIFLALLWLGIYFPERWRLDIRWPWLKWVLTVAFIAGSTVEIWIWYLQNFAAGQPASLVQLSAQTDRVLDGLTLSCIVLFLVAIFDKLRSASTADARRRLRVLAVGSGISFGGLILIQNLLPNLKMAPPEWLALPLSVIWFIVFPLTLAYVVVVQRAMDIRILLRIGTKYLLAKATLVLLQLAILAFVIFKLIVPVLQRHPHQAIFILIGVGILFAVARTSAVHRRIGVGSHLHAWVDRKFFRDAYDAEAVLTELSEGARRFTDRGPLIQTVSRRISEILHVPQIAVWLRGGNIFQLQETLGINIIGPVLLPENSSTVQNLVRTNRPATVYRDRPEEWLTEAAPEEKRALNSVNAELLLALPGRQRLMGVMALGPKKSEEPYTPTDLRVLQSVATQTGLALEVSELAHSLAEEAAQRERINREIEIAREVQQRLFPQELPRRPGLSLAGMCRPALGVGGDYYDLIELEDQRIGIAVGDVSGKGISAALLMASLRASLRGMTLEGPSDLAKTMKNVNRLVYEASANNRYATFFFATFDTAARELRYVNAGHNPPVLLRKNSKGAADVIRLEAGGLVVGLLPFATYEEQAVSVNPGDVLIAYTDGISEAMTIEEEEWGEERMIEAIRTVRERSADEILEAVFQAADEFTAGAPQNDDMTLLIMKLEEDGAAS